MKNTFQLLVDSDINIFNERVNRNLTEGWKFMAGMSVIVTETKAGIQYSVAMLLEEVVTNG